MLQTANVLAGPPKSVQPHAMAQLQAMRLSPARALEIQAYERFDDSKLQKAA